MIKRHLSDHIKRAAKKYPVVTIIGPRQSGKSTLSRMAFPGHSYVSLEDPDRRALAESDPRGFFGIFQGGLIIDEVQRVPSLLSYIQGLVDEPGSRRHFVLTGSHQMALMEKVTQSLAGRTAVAKLLPFSFDELLGRPGGIKSPESEKAFTAKNKSDGKAFKSLEYYLYNGGYPRIYDKKLDAGDWLGQYYMTYVERDVRSLMNISHLDLFDRFVRLCAARAGSLLNLSSLAADCGVSQPTARSWLSILQACFICFTLQPHFKNFNKRLIKMPKIYFYDTGLLCYLLKVKKPGELSEHSMRGAIFENWIISERIKSYFNAGEEPPVYFWRDAKGHEIDLIIDRGESLYPIEIKSSRTFNSDFVKNIEYFQSLQNIKRSEFLGECVYAGDEKLIFKDCLVRPWNSV